MDRNCKYRPARKEDAAVLSMQLREQDQQELMAMHGLDVDYKKVLETAIAVSKECWVAETHDGQMICMFGVSVFNQDMNLGCPWLLGSDKVLKVARELIADGRFFVGQWRCQFDGLVNFVDTRNSASIRYLKKLGFMIHDAVEVGAMNKLFHPFTA